MPTFSKRDMVSFLTQNVLHRMKDPEEKNDTADILFTEIDTFMRTFNYVEMSSVFALYGSALMQGENDLNEWNFACECARVGYDHVYNYLRESGMLKPKISDVLYHIIWTWMPSVLELEKMSDELDKMN